MSPWAKWTTTRRWASWMTRWRRRMSGIALLNCGFRLPAGAGTDAMANFASLRGPVGMNRVYVQRAARSTTARGWIPFRPDELATNGPLLELSIGGRAVGQELALPSGAREVNARVALRSNVRIDHLEVIGNGRVVATVPLAGARTQADTSIRLGGRKRLGAAPRLERQGDIPVLDLYPYATTSPIYLTVAGAPARSAEDADYFMRWIDRLTTYAAASKDWNSEAERDATLDMMHRAREEFARRR